MEISNRVKSFFIFFIIIFSFYFFAIVSMPVFAADSNFMKGVNTTGQGAGYPDPGNKDSDLLSFLGRILGSAVTPIFMGVSGMISFGYAGYKWMMARGNDEDVTQAKAIITNTIMAMVVAFSAYAIVKLITELLVDKTLYK